MQTAGEGEINMPGKMMRGKKTAKPAAGRATTKTAKNKKMARGGVAKMARGGKVKR